MLLKTNEVSSQLLAAADLLREHGWCQNQYIDDKGCICLISALSLVPASVRVLIMVHHAAGTNGAPAWNDAPGRTKEDVLDLLEGLAAKAVSVP
jgi:hypothetical protein